MLYITIAILLLVLSYRYDYCHKERWKKFWFFLILIVFICVAGFRYRLGQDTLNYMYFFSREVKPLAEFSYSEITSFRYAPGFVVLASIFKTFTDDFVFFQLFHSIFVNCVVCFFIKKNCRHIFFAFFLYFFFLYFLFLFQQMRESMAVSVFLLAWPFFRDGKWIKWYLACICAFLFHVSSVILFLLPLICVPGIRNLFVFGRRTAIICVILLLVGFAVQYIFFDLIKMLSFTDSLADRAQTYDKSALGVSKWNIGAMLIHMLRYLIYPLIMLIFLKKVGGLSHMKCSDGTEQGAQRWMMMIMMCVYVCVFTLFITIMLRYTNYFLLFVLISMSDWVFTAIPIMGKRMKFRFGYWIIFILPMLFAECQAEYFGNVNKSGSLRQYMVYYPYASWFDESRDVNREKCYQAYETRRSW